MARQKSIFKLEGEIGGVSFYKTAEGYLAREKGGLSAERVRTDPDFQRTRENGAEFGRAGSAGKLLRAALRPLLKNVADNKVTSRLMREMVKVVKADAINDRGLRNAADGNVELLRGFEFNSNAGLGSTFFAPIASTIDRANGNLTVNIPDYVPQDMITSPQGATHFKLMIAGAAIDFAGDKYEVTSAETQPIVLGPQNEAGFMMSSAVTPATTKPLFLAFGIEFSQKINGKYYPLQSGYYNALSLVNVDKS